MNKQDAAQEFDERCYWCDENIHGVDMVEHMKKHPVSRFEAEVANMLSAAEFCDHFCCELPANICKVRTLSKEIERLLADEREKMREMCAHYLEVEADRDTIVEDELKPLGQTILKTAALHLRLLDLTAPSSTEEGK